MSVGKYVPLIAFGALFVASEIVIATNSAGAARTNLFAALAFVVQAMLFALLCWATTRLTASGDVDRTRGRAFALQVAACAAVIVGTALRGDFTHYAAGSPGPWWQAAHGWLFRAFAHAVSPDIALGLVNFVDYAVPIGVVLLVLGVPVRAMGLGAFRSGWLPTALVWLALPIGGAIFELATGRTGASDMGMSLFLNLLQNGFSEEFLFRGALLGRLLCVLPLQWALVVQAFAFGLWHLHASAFAHPHALMIALAMMVANHAVMGLAMGYLTIRTGNIAIPSAFHLLLDTVAG
jgi:membrane protease YdiL (CAAX protease family)